MGPGRQAGGRVGRQAGMGPGKQADRQAGTDTGPSKGSCSRKSNAITQDKKTVLQLVQTDKGTMEVGQ